jgi:hypothetical protein
MCYFLRAPKLDAFLRDHAADFNPIRLEGAGVFRRGGFLSLNPFTGRCPFEVAEWGLSCPLPLVKW